MGLRAGLSFRAIFCRPDAQVGGKHATAAEPRHPEAGCLAIPGRLLGPIDSLIPPRRNRRNAACRRQPSSLGKTPSAAEVCRFERGSSKRGCGHSLRRSGASGPAGWHATITSDSRDGHVEKRPLRPRILAESRQLQPPLAAGPASPSAQRAAPQRPVTQEKEQFHCALMKPVGERGWYRALVPGCRREIDALGNVRVTTGLRCVTRGCWVKHLCSPATAARPAYHRRERSRGRRADRGTQDN